MNTLRITGAFRFHDIFNNVILKLYMLCETCSASLLAVTIRTKFDWRWDLLGHRGDRWKFHVYPKPLLMPLTLATEELLFFNRGRCVL